MPKEAETLGQRKWLGYRERGCFKLRLKKQPGVKPPTAFILLFQNPVQRNFTPIPTPHPMAWTIQGLTVLHFGHQGAASHLAPSEPFQNPLKLPS
jgi:hypothetical protein